MSFISPIQTDTNGQPKQTGSLQALGKDDFLKLLVTKMSNQDPLDPMADEDFIAQLAQFSSLEQMYNISEGIAEANQWDFLQMQSLNNTLASGLIGKEVVASYDGVYFDGDNDAAINFTTTTYADEIEFTIRAEDGSTIATLSRDDVQPGNGQIEWDGRDRYGNKVDPGYYTVEVSATGPGGANFTPSLKLVGVVSSISYRDGGAFLNVNGSEIKLGDIVSVGEPGSFSGDED
jgi:flagellar basal-body rod modification protein FlgD